MVKQTFVIRINSRCLIALAISLGLMASACTSNSTGNSSKKAAMPVTVTDTGCDPNQLTVDTGRTTFVITNKSARALEWEILEGVMVVEEKENIAPGFVQKLKANLKAGQYDMTCGLLSNPKGKIVVTEAKSGVRSNNARSNQIATMQPNLKAVQTNSSQSLHPDLTLEIPKTLLR